MKLDNETVKNNFSVLLDMGFIYLDPNKYKHPLNLKIVFDISGLNYDYIIIEAVKFIFKLGENENSRKISKLLEFT